MEARAGNEASRMFQSGRRRPLVGCQNTREWGIRFPERSGLNHNLADPFRENKKFKVFLE